MVINGKPRNRSVGKIIAENFLSKRAQEGSLVKHLDGNKQNNSVENLYWITPKENAQEVWERRRENGTTGAGIVKKSKNKKRENIVDYSALVEEDEKQIILDGEPIPYAISKVGKGSKFEERELFVWFRFKHLSIY